MGRRALSLAPVAVAAVLWAAPVAQAQATKEDRIMSEEIASELKRLRHNQAVLMTAINRIIADTTPIELADPADDSSGYVTTGLTLDAGGTIVPGRIAAPAPQSTSRGIRPGDPLWVESPGTP